MRDKSVTSYRNTFGLDNPPPGTIVDINFLEGCDFSIIWPGCPDGENVIEAWFKKRQDAIDYVTKNKWVLRSIWINKNGKA